MTRFRRLFSLASLPTALLLAQPMAAHADPLRETVTLSDLDLSSQGGIDAANRRFDVAARRVCMDHDNATLAGLNEYEACRTEALSQARPVLDRLIAQARPTQNGMILARAGD